MRRRVVVTGMGCVTPLGCTPERLWDNLMAGKSGVAQDDRLRRQQLPHENLGRSAQLVDRRATARIRPSGPNAAGTRTFAAGAAKQAVGDSGVLDGAADGRGASIPNGSAFIWAPAKGSRISSASRG